MLAGGCLAFGEENLPLNKIFKWCVGRRRLMISIGRYCNLLVVGA